jgi:hypothetical protein
VLRQSHGGALPHLALDLCALTLSEDGYVALFARAVEHHLLAPGDPVDKFAARWTKMNRVYDELAAQPTVEAAVERARAHPDAAVALLAR